MVPDPGVSSKTRVMKALVRPGLYSRSSSGVRRLFLLAFKFLKVCKVCSVACQ